MGAAADGSPAGTMGEPAGHGALLPDAKTIVDMVNAGIISVETAQEMLGLDKEKERINNDSALAGDIDKFYSNALESMAKRKMTLSEYLEKKGIKRVGEGNIGFCEKEQKWYGWSHRAIYGFGVGSKITKDSAAYKPDKGEWTAKTLHDAKRMAKDFAEAVS